MSPITTPAARQIAALSAQHNTAQYVKTPEINTESYYQDFERSLLRIIMAHAVSCRVARKHDNGICYFEYLDKQGGIVASHHDVNPLPGFAA